MKIFGILNLTTDSFSDGGMYLDPQKAMARAAEMVRDGAWAIDLGAQSSNPDSALVPVATERERLDGMIRFLRGQNVRISVDTFRHEVIDHAIRSGVDCINNIRSFADDASLETLQEHSDHLPLLVLMHSASGDMAKRDSALTVSSVVDEILRFFDRATNRLLAKGVPQDRLVYDPGMGFFLGPDPLLSIQVLRKIPVIRERLGPVMVSVSRKSFIGNLLGGLPPAERSAGTLAVESWLVAQGAADYIRTHDVLALSRAAKLVEILENPAN